MKRQENHDLCNRRVMSPYIRFVWSIFSIMFLFLVMIPSRVYAETATEKPPRVQVLNIKRDFSVGDSYYFFGRAINLKQSKLRWYSSNRKVADIDTKTGKMQAISEGTCIIRLADMTSKKRFRFTITVSKCDPMQQNYAATDFIRGLDLAQIPQDFYTTEQEQYIETSQFIVFLPQGIQIPTNLISIIQSDITEVTHIAKCSFYQQNSLQATYDGLITEMTKLYSKPKQWFNLDASHKKLMIMLTDQTYESSSFLKKEGVIVTLDAEKWNQKDFETSLVYQLLHTIHLRNGYSKEELQSEQLSNQIYDQYYTWFSQHQSDIAPGNEDYVIINHTLLKYNGSAESITIPEGITKIAGKAFYQQTTLKSITIPDTVTIIEPDSFLNCTRLEEIQLSPKITDIPSNCFAGCSNLVKINIPKGVKRIENGAFSCCTSLKQVTIPKTVVGIGASAFMLCKNLKDIYLPASIKEIAEDAFYGCKDIKITATAGSYAREYADHMKEMEN